MILATIIATVLVFATVPQVEARNGIPGGEQARIDFLNSAGTDKDTSCSPYENTDAYCTGYKIAYEAQWAYMSAQYDCSSGECK